MSREELSVFLQSWFCGCGDPAAAAGALLRLLRLHPLYDHGREFDALLPDEGLGLLVLYTLDRFALTEHGGSVGGAWLTEKGEAVRDALAAEEGDGFAALLDEPRCVHGYTFGDDHDCMAAA